MDWANEIYVKLYVRDTADRLAIGWEGNAVLDAMLRKCDRSGIIDTPEVPILASILRIPADIVEPCVERLLSRGVIQLTELGFILSNFQVAQDTPKSGKQRALEYRERRSLEALNRELVTKRDATVTKSDEIVTLTPGCVTKSSRIEENRIEYKISLVEFRELAVSHLNLRVGARYRPHGKATAKLLNKLAADYTSDQVIAVIDAKHAEWQPDPAMRKFLRPVTLFGNKFHSYHADVEAAPQGNTQSEYAWLGEESV